MRDKQGLTLTTTLALLSSLVLSACSAVAPPSGGSSGASATSKAGLTVVVGHAAEETSLDPSVSTQAWLSVLYNMYDTLVDRDQQGNLAPGLAESWQQPNPTTLEFKLRKGVTFHGGEPFDANDVKFTIERALDPETKSQQRQYVARVKEVQVVDSHTVRLMLSETDPFIVHNLMLVPMTSSRFVQQKGAAVLANTANGTGPFRFVEWVRGDRLTMEAFPNHWRGAPKIAKGVFRVIPEPAALVSALQVGEVDIAVNLLPDNAQSLASASGVSVKSIPSQRGIFIVLDPKSAPLNDVRVRQALNYAVDKEELTKGVLLGYADPIPTLLPSMYYGYNGTLKPYPYDPAKAKQLLADAGLPNGFELTLDAPSGRYLKDKEVVEAIAGQLGRVGIQVKLSLMEWGRFVTGYQNQQLSPAYLIGFGTPVWDFSQAFRTPSASRSRAGIPDLDPMAARALTTVDDAQRKQLLLDLNKKIHDEAAYLFLYALRDIYGASNRIEWTPRSDERVWLFDVAPR